MAEFAALVQQYQNLFVITRLEFGIGIYIDDVDVNPELGRQRAQCQRHLVAEMAVGARDQRQPGQFIRPSCPEDP